MGKWLVKSDPETYSFHDLKRDGATTWDGVRNALAQIHLREMKKGDAILVYHSGGDKAIMGIAEVKKAPYPDATDKSGKSVCVDIEFGSAFKSPVTLSAIKADESFKDFALVRMPRLSVMPVSDARWKRLIEMGK